jgi:Glycosyltransferase 61
MASGTGPLLWLVMKIDALLIKSGRLLRLSTARTASLLPGSSIHFGPPRKEAAVGSINDPSVLRRHQLLPERRSRRPIVDFADPPLDRDMLQPTESEIKEVFIAEIPQGRYWGRYHGYILDRNDTLLTDLSPTFTPNDKRHDGLEQPKLPPLKELKGVTAVINSLFAFNFHHWLLDTVPRFEWLRRAGWPLDKIDHFILPKRLMRHHLEILSLLGIDPAKAICSSPDLHVRSDLLLVPNVSQPLAQPGEYDYQPEGLRFVRELFLTNNPFLEKKHPSKILISREKADARRLVHAEQTTQALLAQGFEKVLMEDYPLLEQAAMFNQADCIVMPTGGNLANLVFCRPGTTVVELFGMNYCPTFSHAMMGEIGFRYYGLVGEKVSRPFPEARFGNEDIDLDPTRLDTIVRQALASMKPVATSR